jgi:hypothetical protein
MNIIVSRYNEDVSWTKEYNNIILYNKGEKLSNNYDVILLENVGREGHTYYKYIYDNYEFLPEYSVFLQGNPLDHSPNFKKRIYDIQNKISNGVKIDFEYLSEKMINCNLNGCIYHRRIPLCDIHENVFGIRKENMHFVFGQGGQFIVSKERILKRRREFYFNIVKMLEYDSNPIEGNAIERFHKLIFSDYCLQ